MDSMARFVFPEAPLRTQEVPVDIGPNGMSIDLLRAVYRNPALPLPVRLRAAGLALPHETPKLMATAIMNEQSFAELLDRRLKHQARIENGRTTEPIERPMMEPPKPLPRSNDRRLRRM